MAIVTEKHFGANLLAVQYNKDSSDNFHSLDPGAQFIDVLQELGTKYIRFPGGGIVEKFTENKIFYFFQKNLDITFEQAVYFCLYYGVKMHYVFPSVPFKELGRDYVWKYMRKIAAVPGWDKVIETIEVGNEYWAFMTPAEYGKIANEIVVPMKRFLDSVEVDIPIFVQQKAHWSKVGTQDDLLAGLSNFAKNAMGGWCDHWYPSEFPRANYYDPGLKWASKMGKQTHISEWNLHNDYYKAVGVEHAYQISNMFWALVHRGIDYCSIWGIQYRSLPTKLTGVRWNGRTYFNAAGEVYKSLKDLVGYSTFIDSTGPGYAKGKSIVRYFYGVDSVTIPEIGSFKQDLYSPVDAPDTGWVDESQETQDQMCEKTTSQVSGNVVTIPEGCLVRIEYEL